jgi:hypothetical protein
MSKRLLANCGLGKLLASAVVLLGVAQPARGHDVGNFVAPSSGEGNDVIARRGLQGQFAVAVGASELLITQHPEPLLVGVASGCAFSLCVIPHLGRGVSAGVRLTPSFHASLVHIGALLLRALRRGGAALSFHLSAPPAVFALARRASTRAPRGHRFVTPAAFRSEGETLSQRRELLRILLAPFVRLQDATGRAVAPLLRHREDDATVRALRPETRSCLLLARRFRVSGAPLTRALSAARTAVARTLRREGLLASRAVGEEVGGWFLRLVHGPNCTTEGFA